MSITEKARADEKMNAPRRSSVSPSRIIKAMPITYSIFSKSLYIFMIFNAVVIYFHRSRPGLFDLWITYSQPVVNFVSNFVPAINQIASYMAADGYGERIPVVTHVIACNFVILLALVPTFATFCSIDFLKKGPQISMKIYTTIHRSGREYYVYWILYFVATLAFSIMVFTRFMYSKPQGLYYNDFEFLLIGFLFHLSFSSFSALFALSLTAFYDDPPSTYG